MKMSFEGWCDYLASKDAQIQRAFLNFSGRNQVLFHLGKAGVCDDARARPVVRGATLKVPSVEVEAAAAAKAATVVAQI